MGNDGVSELFPDNDGGGGESPTPSYAYTEVFNRAFPYYLSIGMTCEQFWEQDVELARFYREAWRMRQEQKNYELWLQGRYIYDAMRMVFPLFNPLVKKGTKVEPYYEEPYAFKERRTAHSEPTVEQKSDSKAKAAMEMFMVNFNRKFEKKGGEENGSKCNDAGH